MSEVYNDMEMNQTKLTNLQIADLLKNVAACYQLESEAKNKFKIIAYQRAADAVEHATSELKDLFDEGKLEDIPGVGPSIASHLTELFKTGRSKHFDEVMKDVPAAVFELMKVQGIGPKTALKLVKTLGISNFKELEEAAKAGKIAKLEGFGEDSQAAILKSLSEVKGRERRLLFPYADVIAQEIIQWMNIPAVKKINPLGSLRRKAATIGDLDIAVATDNPQEVLEHFVKYPKAQRVLEKGTISAGIVVPGDVQVDLMVQPPNAYGALLQHFTGSKHHNIALRELALKQGLSLSEKGIKDLKTEKMKSYSTEEDFYRAIGLDWIPPELREDAGEIEKAAKGELPKLIELKDVRADLQMHSDFDIETSHDVGASSMRELVEKANSLGYEYIAFTEHNPSRSKHRDAEIVELLKRKKEKVDQINYSVVKGMKGSIQKVFNSLEIDIMPSGALSVPDLALEYLDFALVSIHSQFRLPRAESTKRILDALNHEKVKIMAHPTGRKINERESVDADWLRIFEFCAKNNKFMEINCDPGRLDLPDFLVKEAKDLGCKFTLGTDAHHVDHMDNMVFGINVARRGWLEKKDVLNSMSLHDFTEVLK